MHIRPTNRERGLAPSRVSVAVRRGALASALISALLFLGARSAQAQSETTIYKFCAEPNCSDGAEPEGRLIFDQSGNLYGTTAEGGAGSGTVFELSRNGSGGWTEAVLYSFTGDVDGVRPLFSTLIFDGLGNLYGTTSAGGVNGYGVVFELSPVGGSWTEAVVYSFAGGTDGREPVGGVIMDAAGNLYGRTEIGGTSGSGTVFELSPSGGSWTEQIIHNFAPNTNGGYGGLTMDASENIFGVTDTTVFELSRNGDGSWSPTVVHSFPSLPHDGKGPSGTLAFDSVGNLYGTTARGGGEYGNGTVFELMPRKKGRWAERILFSFKEGRKDGKHPLAGIVFDGAGNIYGGTAAGGTGEYDGGLIPGGTVFELVAPVGKGGYKEKVLWNFDYGPGSNGVVLDAAGNLYGILAVVNQVFEVGP
jgi:uncharacterized repeat protein (TIGR03803 family)